MIKILFDESHKELLRSQEIPDDEEIDTWGKLRATLTEISCEITPYPESENGKAELTEEELNSYKVLVLAAPREPFSNTEIEAISNFVEEGNSLLIAQCYQSLEDENTPTINLLLEKFGLRTKLLLTNPPSEIHATQFKPHYISAEINRLVVTEPVYLETLDKQPRVVADFPRTGKAFLAAVETKNRGRLVAIGDFVIFGDKKIELGDNKNLVLNIFKWLTKQNSLECFDAQFETRIWYGETGTFSISFSNPNSKRLENINCLLESDAGAVISEPEQRIRSLPANGQTHLRWDFEPQKLGSQTLRLTIDFPEKTNYSPLFFDVAAEFQCVPNAKIDLINLNLQQQQLELVETGVPFEMQGVVRWASGAKQVPLKLQLKAKSLIAPIVVEPMQQKELDRWQITVFDEGDWEVHLQIVDLDQSIIRRFIRAYPSPQKQINDVETNILIPLAANVYHQVSQLRKELVAPEVQEILFRLLTPENYIHLLEPANTREEMLEVLQAARQEEEENIPLVQYILENIAPIYSVIHGCCIPYDPKLAEHLVDVVEQNPLYEEHIAYNFLSINGDERFGKTWLSQNITALLLHEKYGHGFFYSQTRLGQQIAILYRHGLVPNQHKEQLLSPYPRLLYTEYELVIKWIFQSAIIVNEGFATWLELYILPRISEIIGQATYRHRDFLFSRDSSMVESAENSDYFKKSQPQRVSKYREGCEYLELIQGYFGENCGPKCAVQAMLKATDINLGITEYDGQVRFGLDVHQLKDALIKDDRKDARADERLRSIHEVLREHQVEILEKQQKLQCNRSCLHAECPVNVIISAKLNW